MEKSLYALHAEIEEKHWWFRGRRRIIAAVVERLLGDNPDALILDVGCGSGANLAHLSNRYQGVGVDTAEEAISAAREKYGGVTFLRGGVTEARGAMERPADLAMLLDVLEHVEDDAGLLRETLGAVRPGGHLLITVPADMRLWSEHDVAFGHYRRYDRAGLRELWSDADVIERLCSHFNARLYYPVRLVRAIKRKLPAKRRTSHDFNLRIGPFNALLERLFAGERLRLLSALDHPDARGYRTGVSLIAVLQRIESK